MRINMNAQYLSGGDLTQMAETILNASIPPNYVADPNTLTYKPLGTPMIDATGADEIDLAVERTLLHEINPSEANVLVRGLTPAAAAQVLQSRMALAAPPEISVVPAWWPWMPLLPFRINVQ
jgi:hypothetical protein